MTKETDEDKELLKISQMLTENENKSKESETIVSDALIGGTRQFHGYTMRPVTLSTLAMLEKVNSPLVTGETEGINNVIEALIFLWIQTADVSEVRAACLTSRMDSRMTIEGKALEIGESLSLTSMEDLVICVSEMMAEATNTKVESIPTDQAKEGRRKSKNK